MGNCVFAVLCGAFQQAEIANFNVNFTHFSVNLKETE